MDPFLPTRVRGGYLCSRGSIFLWRRQALLARVCRRGGHDNRSNFFGPVYELDGTGKVVGNSHKNKADRLVRYPKGVWI